MKQTNVRAIAMLLALFGLSHAFAAEPRQRVVISDDYTSWLLKSADAERYGEGEALPKLLAEGWTIASVTTSCQSKGRTIYVLNAPAREAKKQN
jgi:hypothetical protein